MKDEVALSATIRIELSRVVKSFTENERTLWSAARDLRRFVNLRGVNEETKRHTAQEVT